MSELVVCAVRLCGRLMDFFDKMKRWVEMAQTHGLPATIKSHVNDLEHKFTVTTLIYRKYHTLFDEVFQAPAEDRRTSKKPRFVV